VNHWNYGRLSGYHFCCVLWFYLRIVPVKIFGVSRVYKVTKLFRKKGTKHILCPIHTLLVWLGLKLKYSTCSECGWVQLGQSPCKVIHLHKTWVVKEIRSQYLRQLRQYKTILIKQPGRIAKEIENEIKKKKAI
jgi:hypothetical protein